MNDISLTILPETRTTRRRSSACTSALSVPGRYAKTAYRLREQVAHSLDVSFTARIGTLLVGSVRLSPIRIGETKALLLGPLTVEPAFRERGVGQALIERALEGSGAPRATGWSSWSATSRITANAASSACRRARHHARPGRSGAASRRRAGRRRFRRRVRADPAGVGSRAA